MFDVDATMREKERETHSITETISLRYYNERNRIVIYEVITMTNISKSGQNGCDCEIDFGRAIGMGRRKVK